MEGNCFAISNVIGGLVSGWVVNLEFWYQDFNFLDLDADLEMQELVYHLLLDLRINIPYVYNHFSNIYFQMLPF